MLGWFININIDQYGNELVNITETTQAIISMKLIKCGKYLSIQLKDQLIQYKYTMCTQGNVDKMIIFFTVP